MRRRLVLLTAIALLASGAVLAATRTRASASSSVLDVVDGAVFLSHGGVETDAREGQTVVEGDAVRTGDDGHAVVLFFDGSTVSLEPETEVRIDAARVEGGATIVVVFQSAGETWHAVHKLLDAGSRYELTTPDLTAAVRGTAFAVTVGDDEDAVATEEGTVEVTAQRQAVRVAPGLRSRVAHGAVPRAAEPAERRPTLKVDLVGGAGAIVDAARRLVGVAPDGSLRNTIPGARVERDGDVVHVVLANPTRGMRFVPGRGLRTVHYELDDAAGDVVASGDAAPRAASLAEAFERLGADIPDATPRPSLRLRTPTPRPSLRSTALPARTASPRPSAAPTVLLTAPAPSVTPLASPAPLATPAPLLPAPSPLLATPPALTAPTGAPVSTAVPTVATPTLATATERATLVPATPATATLVPATLVPAAVAPGAPSPLPSLP